jgi:crossover junction endodeoxyribonuclease RuvC
LTGTGQPTVILGVDPGSYATGWGAVDVSGARPRVVDCGLIRIPRSKPFAVRLHLLREALAEVAQRVDPVVACVEAPFHGINPRSALQLAHARGVVLASLAGASIPVEEVPPATVKQVVAGSGRADKAQVQTMIRRLLDTDLSWDSEDVSDALAVAYCWAVHREHRRNLERAGVPPEASAPRSARRTSRARGPVVRRAR